jgi:hypothetical protein
MKAREIEHIVHYRMSWHLIADNRPWTCVLEEQYYHPRVLK